MGSDDAATKETTIMKYKNFYIIKIDCVTDHFWKISTTKNFSDTTEDRFDTIKSAKRFIDTLEAVGE